jgi:predicted Rossmann fold nucleotide-binding protein DprA/Smf involved in DNA uptake
MKQLKKDLKAVSKDLKTLTQKTNKMIKQFEKLAKSKPAKKKKARVAKKRVARKTTRATAVDTVLSIIKKNRKGVDKATLKKETRLKDNNIRTILYRLKKQGKVKSAGRGIYVKA